MPIAFDPDQTSPFSLESDREKPEASRPVFLVRFLTKRQVHQYDAAIADAMKARATPAEFWISSGRRPRSA